MHNVLGGGAVAEHDDGEPMSLTACAWESAVTPEVASAAWSAGPLTP